MTAPYKTNLILFIFFTICCITIISTGSNKILFLSINSFAARNLPFLYSNLTLLGDTMTACAIIVLFIRRRPDIVISGLVAAIIGTLVVNLLKIYFNTPRPPAVIDQEMINIIGPVLKYHSFPSGHTVTIFALSGVLIFIVRSLPAKLGLTAVAVLTGISRIAVGVHWPVDVLAGAAIGALTAIAGFSISEKLKWYRIKPFQIVIGSLLILTDLYFLIFYDCKYPQAVCFQYFIASVTLIFGIREYYLMLRGSESK